LRYESLPETDICLTTLQTLFVESSIPFLFYRIKGDLFCNKSFEELFDKEEITDLYSLFLPRERKRIRHALEKEEGFHGRVTVRTSQGPIPTHADITPIFDPANRLLGHALLFQPANRKESAFSKKLFYEATHDRLTGLPNRFYFIRKLEEAIRHAQRNGTEGALFFIDLDNFKTINDTLGHEAGDNVLKEAAQRLQKVLRTSDFLARFGGDEFLLLVEPYKNRKALMYLAKRIIKAFDEPFVVNKVAYHIGTSIGIAIFPKDGTTTETLIKNADNAMYLAKKEGKHGFRYYTDAIDHAIKRHYRIEQILSEALEKGNFYLLFQPQIDILGGKVIGFEALLRLKASIGETFTPTEFIPVAEESTLIIRIGRWVFENCCRRLREWERETAIDDFLLSINLSHKQVMDKSWFAFTKTILERYEIPARRIEFEITEKSLLQAGKEGLENIKKITELGCQISIDDFGSGYSSLSDLKKYDFKKLKIDRNLISRIESDTPNHIVKASLAVASAMGLDALAKGVEKGRQKQILEEMGCEEMQGYLFAKPVTYKEVPAFLKR